MMKLILVLRPGNCYVSTSESISYSLDIDFIHGDTHGLSCTKLGYFVISARLFNHRTLKVLQYYQVARVIYTFEMVYLIWLTKRIFAGFDSCVRAISYRISENSIYPLRYDLHKLNKKARTILDGCLHLHRNRDESMWVQRCHIYVYMVACVGTICHDISLPNSAEQTYIYWTLWRFSNGIIMIGAMFRGMECHLTPCGSEQKALAFSDSYSKYIFIWRYLCILIIFYWRLFNGPIHNKSAQHNAMSYYPKWERPLRTSVMI